MKHIRQDPNSTLCGHCCLSMVSDKPLEEIIEMVGHDQPTNLIVFKDIMKELGIQYEIKVFEGDAGYFEPFHGRGFLRVAIAEDRYGQGHAVAFENGVIYDPMNEKPFSNVVDMCMAYLQLTGEIWIVDYVIYTTTERTDQYEQENNGDPE